MGEWKTCNVGDLGTVITGKTPSTRQSSYWGGNTMFVTPKDIQGVKHIRTTERNITDSGLHSVNSSLLSPNAICVSCIGNIGYVAMTTQECISNQQINSIIVSKDNDADFVYYLIRNLWTFFKNYEGQSTALSILNKTQFSKIKVRLPASLEEQKQIASVLSALDDKIEKNTEINKNLEEQAQILVAHYCESNPPKAVLGKILTFVNGFAFQSSSYLPKGTYKVITIKNVQDGKLDSEGAAFVNDIPSRMKPECILHIGDVLLSLTGNVGRVGIVSEENLLLNQRVAKFMPSDASLMPYLYFYFRLPSSKTSLETIAKGTAQQNLSPVETLKLEIPFDETAKELSGSMLPLFEKIISNQMQNQKLYDLRDTLLPHLMSGELDVSDIDL